MLNFEALKTRILFVCLGNICRSPLAEALMNHKILVGGLEDMLESHSAGTADYHVGEAPDSRTLHNARKHGIQIQHVGRQLQPEDFFQYDHILVMDRSNFENSKRIAPSADVHHKIQMLRNFDLFEPGAEVPDPWFGGERGFETVFQILDHCTDQLLKHLSGKEI